MHFFTIDCRRVFWKHNFARLKGIHKQALPFLVFFNIPIADLSKIAIERSTDYCQEFSSEETCFPYNLDGNENPANPNLSYKFKTRFNHSNNADSTVEPEKNITERHDDNQQSIEKIDLEGEEEKIALKRFYRDQNIFRDVGLGYGWQTSFHTRIVRHTDSTINLISPTGEILFFQITPNQSFKSTSSKEGFITSADGKTDWTDSQGVIYSYKGSLLTGITLPSGKRRSIHYDNGRLLKVTDTQGNELHFEYSFSSESSAKITIAQNSDVHKNKVIYRIENKQLVQVISNGKLTETYHYKNGAHLKKTGTNVIQRNSDISLSSQENSNDITTSEVFVISANQDQECEIQNEFVDNDEKNDETSCEVESKDKTTQADKSIYSYSNTQFLNLQTENCESYFDTYKGITRGKKIEQSISKIAPYTSALATSHWFPGIDFIMNGIAISQVSHDVTSTSYRKDNQALYKRLISDGRSVYNKFIAPLKTQGVVSETGGNETTIERKEIHGFRFELIVQQDTLTHSQHQQIYHASIQMRLLYGLDLHVIEIP